MQRSPGLILIFLLSNLLLPNSFAQNPSQFSLPEGATTRFGKGSAYQIQYAPDGKNLAVASSIGIWLYDTKTYREIALLTGHTERVMCIDFSPDGKTLASGSRDKTVRLWDVATRKHKQTLNEHLHEIYSVTFSPDGKTLLSGSTGERDGEQIFGAEIRVWDTSTGKHKRTLSAQGQVNSLAISPDSKIFASGEAWPTYDVQLWDANTGKQRQTLTGHKDWITSVVFGSEKGTLISSSYDGDIRVWDYNTGQQKRVIVELGPVLNTTAFNPDGNLLATGGQHNIIIWDSTSGLPIHTLDNTGSTTSIAFSPDGKAFASVNLNENPIKVWDVATWKQKHTLTGFSQPVNDIAFSPDNSIIASGGFDPNIFLWDVATGKRKEKSIRQKNIVGCIAYNSDSRLLLSGSFDSTVVIWDADTYTKKHAFTANDPPLSPALSIMFSPDLRNFTHLNPETVQMWDILSGELKLTLQNESDFRSVAFSPDGKTLATGGEVERIGEDHSYGYKGIHLWNIQTSEKITTFKGKMCTILCVAYSPDGRSLASGESWADYAVRLWNVLTSEPIFTFKGHTKNVFCVAYSPDGSILASGSADNTIRLWDVVTGKHIKTLTGHTAPITSIKFSSDGHTLASCSMDATILLWDLTPSRK